MSDNKSDSKSDNKSDNKSDSNLINKLVYDYERVDDLQRKGYKIIQDPKRFCFGQDAVLLAGFSKVHKDESVLDLCTGTGIIPILLEARTKGLIFHGLEILPECVDMAKRSIALNGLHDKIVIKQGDIKQLSTIYKPASFDVVTANPPYITNGGGIINAYEPKAIARHEILCSLEDVVSGASNMLCNNGRFYMIHRPHRLCDIFIMFRKYRLEPKIMRLVYPFAAKEPTMVLLEASHNGKPMLKVLPPLIIYDENGKYTNEVYKIYYE